MPYELLQAKEETDGHGALPLLRLLPAAGREDGRADVSRRSDGQRISGRDEQGI